MAVLKLVLFSWNVKNAKSSTEGESLNEFKIMLQGEWENLTIRRQYLRKIQGGNFVSEE